MQTLQGTNRHSPRQCRGMVKYDLMLAEWASGSITNRFPIEFWVYKVISPKTVILAVLPTAWLLLEK